MVYQVLQLVTFKSGDGANFILYFSQHNCWECKNTLTTQADLNETSLEQSLIDIAAITDERGLKNRS